MPKFVIHGSEKEEKVVRLALKVSPVDDNAVSLVAVDKNGNKLPSGYLLSLRADGTVYRHVDVNPELGFTLDVQGRIIVQDNF